VFPSRFTAESVQMPSGYQLDDWLLGLHVTTNSRDY
jgi:hypothetical protein